MAVGPSIEQRTHIIGFREEISKSASRSDDDFFTWFDNDKDAETSFIRANWDFAIHICTPLAQHVTDPEEKIALEIGYGGGRLLSAASRFFKQVIGIDIHEERTKVLHALERRGIPNCHLLKSDGKTIPIDDCSVDLVYSFIVLQHVERFEIFKSYIEESFRVLKPGGVAILYFGRKAPLSTNRSSKLLYLIDRFLELVLLRRGFLEISAKVNCTNLVITLPKAIALARSLGFDVASTLVSRKRVPNGYRLFGGQHGLILKKRK